MSTYTEAMKDSSMKLSGPQRRVLRQLADGEWWWASLFNTRSLIVLVREGYVEAPYGLEHAQVRITDAGRKALNGR